MKLRVFSHLFQVIFLAGATLLLLLIVLSGSIDHFPINRFYWIEADTSGIDNAPSYSRWTFWGICEKDGDKNVNCDYQSPLYPFSPVDNFDTTSGVPDGFINNRDVYYYLTRCSWSFFLIALVFIGVSFVSSLFACCWFALRSVLTFFVTIGLIFDLAGISLQTAAIVLGRKQFKDANLSEGLGTSLIAIGWASFVVVVLAWFGTCCALLSSVYQRHKEHIETEKMMRDQQQYQAPIMPPQAPMSEPEALESSAAPLQPIASAQQGQGTLVSNEGGIRFFKIRRNNKTDEESE